MRPTLLLFSIAVIASAIWFNTTSIITDGRARSFREAPFSWIFLISVQVILFWAVISGFLHRLVISGLK